jgi:hypothetical protein
MNLKLFLIICRWIVWGLCCYICALVYVVLRTYRPKRMPRFFTILFRMHSTVTLNIYWKCKLLSFLYSFTVPSYQLTELLKYVNHVLTSFCFVIVVVKKKKTVSVICVNRWSFPQFQLFLSIADCQLCYHWIE